jgi:hypothetical protein
MRSKRLFCLGSTAGCMLKACTLALDTGAILQFALASKAACAVCCTPVPCCVLWVQSAPPHMQTKNNTIRSFLKSVNGSKSLQATWFQQGVLLSPEPN